MADIAVLGAGGWGMALAISATGAGNNVTIWSPFEEEVKMLSEKRTNERLLSGVTLPESIKITTDMSCVEGAVLTIIATPSTAVRSVAAQLSEYKNYGIVVNVSKGLEKGTLLRLSQVISDELKNPKGVAVLSVLACRGGGARNTHVNSSCVRIAHNGGNSAEHYVS